MRRVLEGCSACARLAAFLGLLLLAAPPLASQRLVFEDLQSRAKALSLLREEGVEPFRLHARFRLLQLEHGELEGSYVLIWMGRDRWREEVRAGNFMAVEVGEGEKVWRLSTDYHDPLRIDQLKGALWVSFPELSRRDKARRARRRTVDGEPALCVKVQGFPDDEEYCFEPSTGVLLQRRRDSVVRTWSEYVPFGAKLVARKSTVSDGSKPAVEVEVSAIDSPAGVEDEIFRAPDGSRLVRHCRDMSAPEADKMTDPEFPPRLRARVRRRTVWLKMEVGEDGVPRHFSLHRPAEEAFNQAAFQAVQQWRFKPAKCGTEPVPTSIKVEINFRTQ
jgi:TonB family protein